MLATMQKTSPRVRGSFAAWFDRKLRQSPIHPTEIAARAGVSSALVSMLRHGRRRPSYEVVVALARALSAEAELDDALGAAELPTRNASPTPPDQVPVGEPRLSAVSYAALGPFAPAEPSPQVGRDGRAREENLPERCHAVIKLLCAELENLDWRTRMQAGLELAKFIEVARAAHDALALACGSADEKPLVRQAFAEALSYYESRPVPSGVQEAAETTATSAPPKRGRRA
jgi:transcriptional regulator with XRE-family HTH domain